MKRWEADKLAVEEGKKIRLSYWTKGRPFPSYIYWRESMTRCYCKPDGKRYGEGLDNCEVDGWELYEEECEHEWMTVYGFDIDGITCKSEGRKCKKCKVVQVKGMEIAPKPSPKLPTKLGGDEIGVVELNGRFVRLDSFTEKINELIEYLKENK